MNELEINEKEFLLHLKIIRDEFIHSFNDAVDTTEQLYFKTVSRKNEMIEKIIFYDKVSKNKTKNKL